MSDAINPQHYKLGDVQPVDIAEHLSFNLGNVVKYVSRAGRKGGALEDLKKSRWYLDREIARLTQGEKPEKVNDGPVDKFIECCQSLKSAKNLTRVSAFDGTEWKKQKANQWRCVSPGLRTGFATDEELARRLFFD